jgi:hypothetical protein
MSTLKDVKYIKQLHSDLIHLNRSYRISKLKLRKLTKIKKDCYSAGYIQHYPEYNSMISDQLNECKQIKKQLRITAESLRKGLYEEKS